MGATLGYWLAAVEPRVAAVAHLCCFADFGPLIEAGRMTGTGIYLTVPGLLDVASNGEIAGLIAPRPQFVGLGDADALTPPAAVEPALASAAGGLSGGGGGGGAAGAPGAGGGACGDAGDAAGLMRFLGGRWRGWVTRPTGLKLDACVKLLN